MSMTSAQLTHSSQAPDEQAGRGLSPRRLHWAALAAILLLAAVLRFANLDEIGYANTYYTAAVKSMLQSWHNFFFVAAEPGGSVSVDKPPLGLWLQAVSAYFLGVNGFAVVLPQIIAGLLSIVVVDHLVRRTLAGAAGMAAGLLAALALAVTPIVIATDRNNTIDSSLILALLLAAWAFIKATETGRLRFLLLGAGLVGLGFNIKMLQAFLPLPAFYALYFLGAREGFWRKTGKLALTSLLLAAISLSWAMAVDLTPADQRPYVGSSGSNSVMSLILGYNGIERLLGAGALSAGGPPSGAPDGAPVDGGPGNGVPAANDAAGQPPQGDGALRGPDGAPPGGPGGPGGGSGGFMGTGQPGVLRLFAQPLSKEMSWLLPFGVLSMGLLALGTRWCWPLAPEHQALVLWGGWLLIGLVFFSAANFFHQYYLSMLAPPLAALVGLGVGRLWQMHEQRPGQAGGVLLAGVGATLAFQVYTALSFASSPWWLLLAAALFIAGMALLAVEAARPARLLAGAAFACLAAAMLLTPGVWSGLTTYRSAGNQALPESYSERQTGGPGFGPGMPLPGGPDDGAAGAGAPGAPAVMPGRANDGTIDDRRDDRQNAAGPNGPGGPGGQAVDQALLAYLQEHTQGMKYLLAAPNSHAGDGYILATGRPVLLMGGFNGGDAVVDGDDLTRLVANGELRYILWGEGGAGGPGGRGGQSEISQWVKAHCTPVTGFNTSNTDSWRGPDGGGALYDCGE